MMAKKNRISHFLKYTAHAFKKYLQLHKPDLLKLYSVDAANKEYESGKGIRRHLNYKKTNYKTKARLYSL